MIVTLKTGTPLRDGSILRADLNLTLPLLKFGVMGRAGSGKSRLIASMPKPLLVAATDPEEKLAPYFDRCGDVTRSVGQFGQPVLVGMSPTTGKPIIQIELFYDDEPKNPQAMTALLARAEQWRSEIAAGMWASFGFDSWTQAEDIARWRRTAGPFAVKDPDVFGRGHGAAKDDLKPLVATRIMRLACNVGIAFHTREKQLDEGGEAFYGMKAIGTLPTELASLLPERYRSTAEADGVTRRLWTRPDGRFDLCTLIDAPSPCANDFNALWENWIMKRAIAANAAAASTASPSEAKGEAS